jgi:hypothetical protein
MGGGAVTASLAAASAGPCLREGWLYGCAVVAGGRLAARGDGFAMSSATSAPYLATGGRVMVEVPLASGFAARAYLDGYGTLLRARLAVAGTPAAEWLAPLASVALGVSLARHFSSW